MILGIYVDDEIIVGNNIEDILKLTKDLEKEFSITIIKESKVFIGLELHKKTV